MNESGQHHFWWGIAFFGSLAAVLLAIAAGTGETWFWIAGVACLAAIPCLMLLEKHASIGRWLIGSPRGRWLRPVAIGACLVGVVAGNRLATWQEAPAEAGSPRYAMHVTALLHDLGEKRAKAHRQLGSAKRRGVQGRIAGELGAAFAAAAGSLRRLRAAGRDRGAKRVLAARLQAVGEAYADLAAAATAADGGQERLDRARRRVRKRTRSLWAAQRRLAAGHYRVVSLSG